MKRQYIVTGMTCAACQGHVERAAAKVAGAGKVSVSLLTNSMTVEGEADPAAVVRAVEQAGYGARLMDTGSREKVDLISQEQEALMDRETPRLRVRLTWSAIFLLFLMYITMGHNMLDWPVPAYFAHNHLGLSLTELLLALAVMMVNRDFFISGFRSLRQGAPNMDVLVALGSGVSFLWSLYVLYEMTYQITQGATSMDIMGLYHDRLYFESAAMIPALITVGKLLESISKGRTTDALKSLLQLSPKEARVLREGEEITIPASDVVVGDMFLVKAGEAIPVDGLILEGEAAIDESALTGESVPVEKGVGSRISQATINTNGYLKARAEKVGEDTSFAQIIRLVSEAAATKAPIARLADTVSAVFVPAVVILAAIVFVIHLALGRDAALALEYAICVLVISCPCALGLATPVAIMVGNGLGAKHGILFKTSEAMEMTGRLQIAALDKTGTITEGAPQVTDILPAGGVSEDELLSLAYGLEKKSEHPLALAIVKAAEERNLTAPEVSDFQIESGHGLMGSVEGNPIHGGSGNYISSFANLASWKEKAEALAGEGKTPIFFERNGKFLGLIAAADVIREDSREAISQMKALGLTVVMVTGDNEKTAKAIGEKAGVDTIIAGVLPEGKADMIASLKKRGRVLMIGDGINDAPALAAADVGMAIGRGTDVAIDSADVVLMNSRLTDAAAAIRLSRATLRNIHENLFWAFAYNVILIPVAGGLYSAITMNPMWAAAAMSLSSVTVCLNALRLNLFPLYDASKDKPLKKRALPAEESVEEIPKADGDIPKSEEISGRAVVLVKGMMCTNCEGHVKKALEELPFIESAKADYTKGEVEIVYTATPAESAIEEALAAADYTYKGIIFPKEEKEMTEVVKIEGMMCGHCEMAVKKAMEALDGVEKAEVSHETGTAVLTLSKEIPDEVLQQVVEGKDYKFIGIEK